MTENESMGESCSAGSTHDEVWHMVHNFFQKDQEERLGYFIHKRCDNMVLALLGAAHERALRIIYRLFFDVVNQIVARLSSQEEVTRNYMIGRKSLPSFQDLKQGYVCQLIMLIAFVVPAVRFVKQEAKNLSLVYQPSGKTGVMEYPQRKRSPYHHRGLAVPQIIQGA